MISLFVSVGLWRQQLPAHSRVHGIITEGGTAANIIPDHTRAWFMIRSSDQAYYDGTLRPRFRELCTAAAMAAHVEVEVEFTGFAATMKHNRAIAERWMRNAEAYGVIDEGVDEPYGSTDMGNVSWVVPSIHPDISIAEMPTPGHTIEFREAAASPHGDETTLLASVLVAQTALDALLDPALRDAAWREFRGEG
jgi:metal-dependent amidase/aminoacylase/carboxypeptidase family protein